MTAPSQPTPAGQQDTLTALFDLGRQVTSVLDSGELLCKIPELIRRLMAFDFDRRTAVIANSGLPFPVRSTAAETRQIGQPGIPLGLFPGSTYDEEGYPIAQGDVFVFCTDGIFEATDDAGDEFWAERLIAVIQRVRDLPARTIIDAIFEAVGAFHGGAAQGDDMTAVVLMITE